MSPEIAGDKPRLLLVDDEPQVLAALQNLLHRHRRIWSISAASSASDALDEMARRPCDVVISDLRMPEVDGARLLDEIRQRHARCIRVVLTGHADQQTLLRALPCAHRVLSKPCGAGALSQLLADLHPLVAARGDDADWSNAASIVSLPSDPDGYARFLDAARCGGLDAMNDAASRDPAIAAKLIQLANSGCFHAPVDSIRGALAAIGPEIVREIVTDPRVFSPADSEHARAIRSFGQNAAAIARLASAERTSCAERRYAAALLADVGEISPGARCPAAVSRYLHRLWALPHPSKETT